MSTTGYVHHDEWYRLVAQNVTDVVLLLDPDRRYLWVSPSMFDVFGWRPDEVVGRNASMFVSEETQELFARARADAQDGIVQLDEVPVRCADESWKWVSIRSAAVTLPDHRVGRVVAVRDIDAAVRARHDAATADIKFRLIAEHATDLVCLTDSERRLMWVSPNVEHSLGWQPADMIGKTLTDFTHPDDVGHILRKISAMREAASPTPQITMFGRLRTRDGGYRWLSGKPKPLLDDGRLLGIAMGLRDVTDLVELKAAAEANAEILRAVMSSARDAIMRFDRDGRIEYVNPEVVRISDWDESQWLGRRLDEMGYDGEATRSYQEHLARVIADGVPRVFEVCIEHPDGRRQWFEANMAPVFGADETVEHVVSSNRDVTDRHRTEAALMYRATRDELTGLSNRTTVMDEVARALAGTRRSGRHTAVLMIDLDHFKYVNDSLGHGAGDELLFSAARRLESLVRAGDLAGRLGGDEFVVVMRDLSDVDDATRLARRIVERFRDAFEVGDGDLYATASVGIAVSGGGTATDLLREADTALYVAKQQGRDRHAVYTASLRAAVSSRLELGGRLRPALERSEFEVWYQPEVDLDSGRTVAMEALLRWPYGPGEMYCAEQFIDVARECGVLPEIGTWVLHQACADAVAWQAHAEHPVAVRVNVCAHQLADPALLEVVDAALRSTGLDPSLLFLEITEHALHHDNHAARAHIAQVRERGVRISIDDFGTGAASLVNLRDMPVDLIKIDRSFVARIESDERDHRIVAGIVALAHQLHVAVTAEGVETDAQAEMLRGLACTGGQGFHFAHPMPLSAVADHLGMSDASRRS